MPLVPAYIKKLKKYKPGKSIQEAELNNDGIKYIKLSSNENPHGSSPLAIKAIEKTYKDLNRYPDASGYQLRSKLAKKFKVKIENVTIGSGSEGIMSTIMRTFLLDDDEIIGTEGSFVGFRVLANASGRKIIWVPMRKRKYDLHEMAKRITDNTKIIYIANPDNPMGTYVTKSDFDAFYNHVPDRVLIILDEAYYEYAKHQSDYPDSMLYRYDNVITLRTFSKAYGLGGLRLGYGLAHKDLIENLNKVKAPFEPSMPAQAAGIAALDDNDFLERTVIENQIEREHLLNEFKSLNIKFIVSYTNFITTIWDNSDDADVIVNKLLNKGIIVRKLSSFGWQNCIRISIGTSEENVTLLNALKSIIH
ncbi:MAG: histidinol-phosphate transaminase [Candidatus Neomarinimicrobiota bacterium]